MASNEAAAQDPKRLSVIAHCNGTADDTTGIQDALNGTAPLTLTIPPGQVCRVSHTLKIRSDVEIVGAGATLLCDLPGVCVIGDGVRLQVSGLTIDGNEKAMGLVDLVSSDFTIFDTTFRNVFSRTAAKAFSCWKCGTGTIRNSTFENIRALGNGVEGDFNGVSRGIFLSGAMRHVTVSDNTFRGIHSVAADGRAIMEDADAIHCYGDKDAHVIINHNSFADVGKRAIKIQCNYATASNNSVESSWSTSGKVMFAGISVYGDHVVVTGNRLVGSSYQHGIEIGNGIAKSDVVIENNVIHPSHRLGDTGPYGHRSGIIALRQTNLRIASNEISGFYYGILVRDGSESLIENNIVNAAYPVCTEGVCRGVLARRNSVVTRHGETTVVDSALCPPAKPDRR